MASKTSQLRIRETKQNLFNFLKVSFPDLFGDKVWADVVDIMQDPEDVSKLMILFKEE